jgi:hypothetical protein
MGRKREAGRAEYCEMLLVVWGICLGFILQFAKHKKEGFLQQYSLQLQGEWLHSRAPKRGREVIS